MGRNIEILKSNGVDVDKSLELFGGIETYNDTIVDLLSAIDKKIPELENYIKTGDMTNYAIVVHSLKSDARYFGFMDLGEIAYDHELKSKENNLSYVKMNFEKLKNKALETRSLVKRYLENTDIEPIVEEIKPEEPIEQVEILTEKTFLVADDSNIVRNFIQKAFQGKPVKVVEDGKGAINLIKANKNMVTGMLLDLNMPNVDGFEVLDFLKNNNLLEKIPVSIITGENGKETIDKAYKYRKVDILTKPFSENDLKRVVEKTINIINWN